jgi:hypothetical protein
MKGYMEMKMIVALAKLRGITSHHDYLISKSTLLGSLPVPGLASILMVVGSKLDRLFDSTSAITKFWV